MKTRKLTCCCCGSPAGRWQQHWNRDTGFGICIRCVEWIRGLGADNAEIAKLYGEEGVNYEPSRRLT